ncbi:hypothetical protein QBC44DRAFT_364127 [Cladorrhinum sp. PSN332]|nr:hypothetical protein QBC44DRAFT_364127 [Cladorrhinum sp. PSN332]
MAPHHDGPEHIISTADTTSIYMDPDENVYHTFFSRALRFSEITTIFGPFVFMSVILLSIYFGQVSYARMLHREEGKKQREEQASYELDQLPPNNWRQDWGQQSDGSGRQQGGHKQQQQQPQQAGGHAIQVPYQASTPAPAVPVGPPELSCRQPLSYTLPKLYFQKPTTSKAAMFPNNLALIISLATPCIIFFSATIIVFCIFPNSENCSASSHEAQAKELQLPARVPAEELDQNSEQEHDTDQQQKVDWEEYWQEQFSKHTKFGQSSSASAQLRLPWDEMWLQWVEET